MSGIEPRGLSCPRVEGLSCSTSSCPGLIDPGVCQHLAGLTVWRGLTAVDQFASLESRRPTLDPAVRDAVLACLDRGPVLPVSMQPECGCAELTECRAGRGKVAGRVTLRECLECKMPSRGP